MDEVIRIEKTYAQRLREYRDIFTGDGPFTLSTIRKELSVYLELQVECSGWQAIWKVPKATCKSYKIDFPTILLVFVENIDWKQLVAKVKVLAVLDDIHLPEMHVVPVIQLWPLKDQDNRSVFDAANALDVVRFFYINLCLPWDDDYEASDWIEQHLESRLQIFYDLKSGTLPRNMAKHVRYLLTTAKNLQEEMENNGCEEELIELQVSLVEIQKEVELLENPLARKVLINRAKQPVEGVMGVKDWLISNEGSLDEYIGFISQSNNKEEKSIDDDRALAPSLLDAWDTGSGTTFILNRGTHCVEQLGVLEEGGILTSTSGKEKTKITSQNTTVMFDFSADVLLENLTLICSAQSAIIVRRGKLTIRNCKIAQDTNSGSYQGVVVLNGASLEISESTIVGFNYAVIGNKNSSISIKNCDIIDVGYGLKVCDDCSVELDNTKINNCSQYGVWVDARSGGVQQLIAGFPVLEKMFSFKINNVVGGNNRNGDVIINYKDTDFNEIVA